MKSLQIDTCLVIHSLKGHCSASGIPAERLPSRRHPFDAAAAMILTTFALLSLGTVCDEQAYTPGLNKNEINVEVVDGDDATHKFLVVSGESDKTTETDGIKATRYAKFERRVRLPGNLPKDSIDAKYEDGVLTVKVAAPPAPVEQPKKVEKIAIA